jgi:hypothetical protein
VGIQALVISMAILTALVLGMLGASFNSLSNAGWLAVATVPGVWTILHVLERLIGRDVWEYPPPYPYSSMPADNGVTRREEATSTKQRS